MKFTRDGIVYEGFSTVNSAQHIGEVLSEGGFVVLVWFDGEPELWVVSGEAGLENLMTMFVNEWGKDRITCNVLQAGPSRD